MASRIRRVVPLVLVVAVLMVAHEVIPHEGIHQALAQVCNALTPLGAIPPAIPEWCFAATTGAATFTQGPNSWLGDWDHRVPVCSLYAPTPRAGDPALFGTSAGRVWEMSNFEHVGTTSFGGFPANGLEKLWRTCVNEDPDTTCRDRFRMELTKTSVTLYVNGSKYFEQTGLKVPFPDELVNGDVYVYMAGWQVRQPAETIRFHWDHLAINPAAGPSAAPGFGSSPPPTPTTLPPPTTPTATPTPSPVSPTPTATATAPQQRFTTGAVVAPTTVTEGETVTISATVSSATATTALIDIEVYRPT